MLASHDKEPWTQIEWKWLVTKLTRANQCWIPYVSVHAGGMKSLFCVPYCSIKLCAIYPLRWLESTRCRRATAFLCRRRCLAALFDKTYGCIVRTNDEHCSMMTCGDMVTYDVLRSGAFGTRDGDRLAVSCLCCRAMVEHHILFPKCWVFGHATWLHQTGLGSWWVSSFQQDGFGHVVQVHSLAVVGLPRSELLQDVPHASGFDLHLGVRLCMLMHAYATVQFGLELAWFWYKPYNGSRPMRWWEHFTCENWSCESEDTVSNASRPIRLQAPSSSCRACRVCAEPRYVTMRRMRPAALVGADRGDIRRIQTASGVEWKH